MRELRHIAVHVQEPWSGQFSWVLTECASVQQWQEIDRSTKSVGSYQRAMADGLLALQKLIPDLDVGPRGVPTKRQHRGRVRTGKRQEEETPRRGAYFGFGPAR